MWFYYLLQVCCADDREEATILRQLLSTRPSKRMPQEEGNETLKLEFGMTPIYIDVKEGGVAEVFGWEKYVSHCNIS